MKTVKKKSPFLNRNTRSFALMNTPPIMEKKNLTSFPGGNPFIQPKLRIGQPNDKYELEADRVANQVMRMPEPKQSSVNGHWSLGKGGSESPLLQRQSNESPECNDKEEEEEVQTKPISEQITPLVQRQLEPEEEEEETAPENEEEEPEKEEEEPVQAKLNDNNQLQRQEEAPEEEEEEVEDEETPVQAKQSSNQTPPITAGLQNQIQSMQGGGQPLSKAVRNYFEPRFGHDFSQVRVHTDSKAADAAKSINAKAFTKGKDVVFGAGQYSHGTSSGKLLLAHELVHVLQQCGNMIPLAKQVTPDSVPMKREVTPSGLIPVYRKVRVAGQDWDQRRGQIFIWLRFKRRIGRASARRARLLKAKRWRIWDGVLRPLIQSRQRFSFASKSKLYQDLLRRYWLIRLMAMIRKKRCCGYPGGYPINVNKAARLYWKKKYPNKPYSYEFELTPKGEKLADVAVRNLFVMQSKKGDRTLLDCKHMISALHYYSLLKSLGAKTFRLRVKYKHLRVAITSMINPPFTGRPVSLASISKTSAGQKVPSGTGGILKLYRPKDKNDLIPGDHVYFSNHSLYTIVMANLKAGRIIGICLPPTRRQKRNCQDIWRGEHAVYRGKKGGKRLFQGHGTGVLKEEKMINLLLWHYNCHAKQANKCKSSHKFPILKGIGDIPGLRDPNNLNRMHVVLRPVGV